MLFYFYKSPKSNKETRRLFEGALAKMVERDKVRVILSGILTYPTQAASSIEIEAREELLKRLARAVPDVFPEVMDRAKELSLELMIPIGQDSPNLLVMYLDKKKDYVTGLLSNDAQRNRILASLSSCLGNSEVFLKVVQILLEGKVYSRSATAFLKVLEIPHPELKQRIFYEVLKENPDLLWQALIVVDESILEGFVELFVSLDYLRPSEAKRFIDGVVVDGNEVYASLKNIHEKIYNHLDEQGSLPEDLGLPKGTGFVGNSTRAKINSLLINRP